MSRFKLRRLKHKRQNVPLRSSSITKTSISNYTSTVYISCNGCTFKYPVKKEDAVGSELSPLFRRWFYIFKCPLCWTKGRRAVTAFKDNSLNSVKKPTYKIPDYIHQ